MNRSRKSKTPYTSAIFRIGKRAGGNLFSRDTTLLARNIEERRESEELFPHEYEPPEPPRGEHIDDDYDTRLPPPLREGRIPTILDLN